MRKNAYTLVELLVTISIALILCAVVGGAGWRVYEASALAVSANNIRQLAAGGILYLADNNNNYWPYRQNTAANGPGVSWWFGFESASSLAKPEGQREFDPSLGPLGGFAIKGIQPDPSFALQGHAFKPKYKSGYIGIGYNVLLGGGFLGVAPLINHAQLADPSKVVVFFTAAQVNTFQYPASTKNPMIEEFYGIDATEKTAHFVNGGNAMVSFATGNAGFLPMDQASRDQKMPNANVGRFAPVGDTSYLK